MSFFFGKLNETIQCNRVSKDKEGVLLHNGEDIISGKMTSWKRWDYNKTDIEEINSNNGDNKDMRNLKENLNRIVNNFNNTNLPII